MGQREEIAPTVYYKVFQKDRRLIHSIDLASVYCIVPYELSVIYSTIRAAATALGVEIWEWVYRLSIKQRMRAGRIPTFYTSYGSVNTSSDLQRSKKKPKAVLFFLRITLHTFARRDKPAAKYDVRPILPPPLAARDSSSVCAAHCAHGKGGYWFGQSG